MIENARRNREAITALFGIFLVPMGVVYLLFLVCGGYPRTDKVLAIFGYYGIAQLCNRVVTRLMHRWYPIEGDGPAGKVWDHDWS